MRACGGGPDGLGDEGGGDGALRWVGTVVSAADRSTARVLGGVSGARVGRLCSLVAGWPFVGIGGMTFPSVRASPFNGSAVGNGRMTVSSRPRWSG